jgi:hypothetical protein
MNGADHTSQWPSDKTLLRRVERHAEVVGNSQLLLGFRRSIEKGGIQKTGVRIEEAQTEEYRLSLDPSPSEKPGRSQRATIHIGIGEPF